ncbi:shikimate dehydrogenase [Nocardioides panacisoli]|uniref:shikimate dehydrogenase n=1 Tax=Nocardioides panacisoli TaxID=627624 RepID=UPI001C624FF6|nr:shikimate dehydrogenase [Nocardioides panacisoli]QYJ03557.1 shikimate dehydrogenase [Nocardioides panacisoli]
MNTLGTAYRVGLLGHGIGPSLTPAMHEREAGALGLDYRYETIDLLDREDADLGAELDRLEREGFVAVNVTHPFKRAVLEHVHDVSDAVRRIGATNLVLLGERRVAHNTDYAGFRDALEDFVQGCHDGPVLQVGAGGAGLATVCALLDLGFDDVVVHDRSEPAAGDLVARLGEGRPGLRSSGGDLAAWVGRAAGVVHVTPTGMREHPGVALDVDRLPSAAWVAEVVYRPLETELVQRARGRGLAVLDGGAMAVGQALESLRLITGLDPDAHRVHAHFTELVGTGP